MNHIFGLVAQWTRARGYELRCQGFESLLAQYLEIYDSKIFGVSPSGKAVDFDSAIRRFESCHPSYIKFYNLITTFLLVLFTRFYNRVFIIRCFYNKDKMMEAKIQFIKGLDEKVLPDVRLTRSRDGSTGTATFRFKNPNILDKSTAKEGEITGMYLVDEEGILETRDVNARFINGKAEAIESIYIMKSPETWDRFMRFMERYGKTNGLVFTKAN